jgi:diamine N-acetyltransferase
MEIKLATQSDIPTIHKLAHSIWPSAYGSILSAEQLAYMLELIYSEQALQQQFSVQTFVLIGEGAEPLGFAAYEQFQQKLKLHKIYVLPKTQGTGVGKQLLKHVLQQALDKHCQALYLNVNKYNKSAIAFYIKQGFTIAYEEVIDIGNGFVMDDYVMEKQV